MRARFIGVTTLALVRASCGPVSPDTGSFLRAGNVWHSRRGPPFMTLSCHSSFTLSPSRRQTIFLIHALAKNGAEKCRKRLGREPPASAGRSR